MTGRTSRLTLVVLVVLFACGSVDATISVYPVIIEAVEVRRGQFFEIVCQNWHEHEVSMELSLALFDQDEAGRVVFLEDEGAVQRAADALTVDTREFSLMPREERKVCLELQRDNFDHLYAVLFITPRQGGVQTRFAVLFLLSTAASELEVSVSYWEKQPEALALTVQNKGLRHGLWEGELLLFDESNQLGEKWKISSGVVLAGRSRGLEVPLPPWVQRVEILSVQQGQIR